MKHPKRIYPPATILFLLLSSTIVLRNSKRYHIASTFKPSLHFLLLLSTISLRRTRNSPPYLSSIMRALKYIPSLCLLFATRINAEKACKVLTGVTHTFYGYPDNDPPGANILYNCGRGNTAGGIGTYGDPLTFASGRGEFEECEIIYVPYLQKYLRHEDYCATCDKNWDKGTWHIDVWTGSTSANGQDHQISCENSLTPAPMSIVRSPGKGLPVDGEWIFLPFSFCL